MANHECSVNITHIGERLLAALLNDKTNGVMQTIAGSKDYTAVPEAEFGEQNETQRRFDGLHKIDVLLVPDSSEEKAVPIELKLGKSRMEATQSGFGRFLTGYKLNEKTQKFSGSMISILGRVQSEESKKNAIRYPLMYGETEIKEEWILIVLTDTIKKELKDCCPWKGIEPAVFSFEKLFGGQKTLVQKTTEKLVCCDSYYDAWIN